MSAISTGGEVSDQAVGRTRVPTARKLADTLATRRGKAFVWALAILWTVPTFGLLLTSFRPEREIKSSGWWMFFAHPDVTLDNYAQVLGKRSGIELGHFFLNSIIITIPSVVISVLLAAMASYAFSWMKFKGRDALFVGVVAMLVVPLQMAVIPLLRLFTQGAHIGSVKIFPALGLTDSFVAVWIAHTVFGMPFCIFILKNFIASLPSGLIEAARIDGASHLQIFRRIVMPLSLPSIASLGIFQFIYIWNDFFVGKIFGGIDRAPVTAKLVEISGNRGQAWHLLTSAAFISMVVPLAVFFSLQRYFVKGLLAGSLKG
jgi:alpha-glucoside transport system permease protein